MDGQVLKAILDRRLDVTAQVFLPLAVGLRMLSFWHAHNLSAGVLHLKTMLHKIIHAMFTAATAEPHTNRNQTEPGRFF